MSLKQKTTNMTEGSIPSLLIRFAVPLLLGNIFQQLYNMVDTWVVGNYVSNEAFSAVGSVGPIINCLIGFFMGLASGAGVVVSQYFGAGKDKEIQEVVHTAIAMTLVFCVIMTAAGIALKDILLSFMKTPADVLPQSRMYLNIYFAGISGLLFYNVGAAILRAVGDSKRPFYFLAVSALLNIAGDLFFVLVLHMGVEGVALATVLAQAVSALLTIIALMQSNTSIRLHPSKIRLHMNRLMQIVRIGIPAAVQMCIISFSNIFVQGYINQFGSNAMSGWTAYNKIDTLMLLPMQTIGLSITTFVGQNIGVGKYERVDKGVTTALILSFVSCVIPMIPVMIFAPQLVAFFNPKPEVVECGTLILRVMSPFYALTCSSNIHSSALRGAGNTKIPMMIQVFSYVIFRQIYLFVMSNFISNKLIPVVMGYPCGWIIACILLWICYKQEDFSRHAVTL